MNLPLQLTERVPFALDVRMALPERR